ncbi:hypothetical protein PTT_01492 [Pyrenophora teres f. teres 0-1]|uniref:Uncharacterized protein n=1 Tax=Pyrenophora teres f. teres (strain 0-1) TaxID=861557 RepID=E3RD21_PYRTT|nr:hypothetical protein PTT_01492 [Pyrenophora teres f. teres 0-1]KAE8843359.1 hypothetical protein HRS9139_02656 [Pyrenophora teres f. teres]KAE8852387.1 hypothetical protein HRS9122_02674 [Pyrenophora teres f. teres]
MLTHLVVYFKTIFLHAALLILSSLGSASPVPQNNAVTPWVDISGTTVSKSITASLSEKRSAPVDTVNHLGDTQHVEKRVFTSPHMKRAFKVVVGNSISLASWVIDFSMKELASQTVNLNYKLQSTQGLTDTDVTIPYLKTITESDNQYRGNVRVKLVGNYAGKVIDIYFNGEIFGTSAALIWQSMIIEPIAYLDGVQTAISSWTFDQVS